MRIAAASDHAGLTLKRELCEVARALGHEVDDLGPEDEKSVDYPDYAQKVARAVADGQVALGLLVCGTGIGMSISANKVAGARAALCHTEFEARMARAHNDANVVCLGQRVTGAGVARAVFEAFLAQAFEGGRHQSRVDKIRVQERQ